MEYKIKFNYLALALIIILFFTMGCNTSIIPDAPSPSDEISGDSIVPTAGSIIIADGADITKDCTPPLAILSEGAAQMSFSGDGESWTEWIDYDLSLIHIFRAHETRHDLVCRLLLEKKKKKKKIKIIK